MTNSKPPGGHGGRGDDGAASALRARFLSFPLHPAAYYALNMTFAKDFF